LKAWRNGLLQPVMSTEVFDEYREVLIRLSRKYPTVQVGPLIDLIAVEIPLIRPLNLKKKICDDPDDDKFFACAAAAKAKLIISGDDHLLRKSGTLGIRVLTPAQFILEHL